MIRKFLMCTDHLSSGANRNPSNSRAGRVGNFSFEAQLDSMVARQLVVTIWSQPFDRLAFDRRQISRMITFIVN